MGQIRFQGDGRAPKLEMFNESYFLQFDAARGRVLNALADKIFAEMAENENVADEFRRVVASFLQNRSRPAAILPASLEDKEGIDLDRIFDRLNREYFGGRIEARMLWGRDSKSRNRREVRFGSYDASAKLIRVHPRLNQDFVPLSVIELTVYHEMCHQWKPPIRKGGMWWQHHSEFKKKEKEYRYYREARQWEKKHWKKLLQPVKNPPANGS